MPVVYSQHGVIVKQSESPYYGVVTIGNRTYPTIRLGNIEVTTENLDEIFTGISFEPASDASKSMCCYFNNGDSATYGLAGTYGLGLLYNGWAAEYIEANKQTLLPEGWGIPSVDIFRAIVWSTGYNGISGGRAISAVNLSWATNWNGNDLILFNAKPGGNRNSGSVGFLNFGEGVRFMTNTPNNQFYYNLHYNIFELPTNDVYTNYSYIRLYRIINSAT